MNRILLLIAYRCFDPEADTYSREFFQNNESLARIFGVSQKQINTLIQRLAFEKWVLIINPKSPHRKIRLTEKTKGLIYLETESILENPKILLGTIGNSNSNQNFTQKRTRKETLKELSKSDRERFEKIGIIASGGPGFIQAIQENGLMEKLREIISEAGPDPEKDTLSILRHFGGLDNNRGKSFAPDEISQRLKGYFKNGLHINREKMNQEQTPTRVRGGTLI